MNNTSWEEQLKADRKFCRQNRKQRISFRTTPAVIKRDGTRYNVATQQVQGETTRFCLVKA